jgi:hypothetical protein
MRTYTIAFAVLGLARLSVGCDVGDAHASPLPTEANVRFADPATEPPTELASKAPTFPANSQCDVGTIGTRRCDTTGKKLLLCELDRKVTTKSAGIWQVDVACNGPKGCYEYGDCDVGTPRAGEACDHNVMGFPSTCVGNNRFYCVSDPTASTGRGSWSVEACTAPKTCKPGPAGAAYCM